MSEQVRSQRSDVRSQGLTEMQPPVFQLRPSRSPIWARKSRTVCLTSLTIFWPMMVLAQTSIVAVRTPSELIVSADSKTVHTAHPQEWESTCKIRQIGSVFIALANIIKLESTGFDAYAIATTAGKRAGSISDRVAAFQSSVQKPLRIATERLMRSSPALLAKYRKSILGALFVGLEGGSPKLDVVNFRPILTQEKQITVIPQRLACPGEDCPDGFAEVELGEVDAIDRFMKSHPAFWEGNKVQGVRRLVEIEIADKPDTVGPPIDILRITKDGPEWVQKKPQCPEIKRPR